MEAKQAAEQLLVIRTLMERAALYRRALAPVLLYSGVVGVAGGVVGDLLPLHEARWFVLYWTGVAALVLAGAFLLIRRQAWRAGEPVWSPPTRRVAHALLPGLVAGALTGALVAWYNPYWYECRFLVPVWCVLFGLAMHAASFCLPPGLRRFGWAFLAGFLLLAGCLAGELVNLALIQPYWLMAATFGGLHLAYGIYLWLTEPGEKSP